MYMENAFFTYPGLLEDMVEKIHNLLVISLHQRLKLLENKISNLRCLISSVDLGN